LDDLIRFCGLLLLSGLDVLGKRAKLAAVTASDQPGAEVSADERRYLIDQIDTLTCECYSLGMTPSGNQCVQAREHLTSKIGCEAVSVLLKNLRDTIIGELGDQLFAHVPAARSDYFEKNGRPLFGERVAAAFPSADYDIKEAGNCFAVGAWTATVFHLMRVVERGLRVLARDRKVTFSQPIEFQQWAVIIENIESNLDDIDSLPKGEKKSDAQSFYRGALVEARAFKDVWRNHVMHARKSYDEGVALSVMGHVRSFMQRLAENLSEDRTTPLEWK
jgi:hypothetical protein